MRERGRGGNRNRQKRAFFEQYVNCFEKAKMPIRIWRCFKRTKHRHGQRVEIGEFIRVDGVFVSMSMIQSTVVGINNIIQLKRANFLFMPSFTTKHFYCSNWRHFLFSPLMFCSLHRAQTEATTMQKRHTESQREREKMHNKHNI